MKTIIIGFSKPRAFKLYAWLIEKVDGASFDHAYLRLNFFDKDAIYQSTAVGVEFMGYTQWDTATLPVKEYQLSVSDEAFKSLMQFCIDNTGMKYSYLGVLGELLVKLHICKKNPINQGSTREFCSEIIAKCLDQVDPADFNLDADNVTPSGLDTVLTQLKIPRIL